MNNDLKTKLSQITEKLLINHQLKEYTTFKIGGPADFVVFATSLNHITETIKICADFKTPVKILGGGSNVLISDKGFRGVVIINEYDKWSILADEIYESDFQPLTKARLTTVGNKFYTTNGLEYSDKDTKKIRVKTASGMRLIPFIKLLFQNNITGLQWFSGIPATVGGAIYMNIHGGDYFFGDYVHSALLFDGKKTKRVNREYFQFDYDWSILHETKEIILEAELNLFEGDIAKAKALSTDWARRKSLQPQKSVGCVFQNLSLEEQTRLALPTSSVGYLIDKILRLKGLQKGNAIISPSHAAFIENKGNASANDVFYLYNIILEKAKDKLGLELKPEIEFIGDFNYPA